MLSGGRLLKEGCFVSQYVIVGSQSSKSRVLNLEMSNVTDADAGLYLCTATNALGEASQYVRLQVLGEARAMPRVQ